MQIEPPVLKEFIKKLLKNDFKVYRNAGREKVTYVFIEKNNNIGYIQDDYYGCLNFSTVHKPNRNTGTGFRINKDGICKPTIKDAESTFVLQPSWAKSRHADIEKYKSFDDYRKYPINAILKYAEINERNVR